LAVVEGQQDVRAGSQSTLKDHRVVDGAARDVPFRRTLQQMCVCIGSQSHDLCRVPHEIRCE